MGEPVPPLSNRVSAVDVEADPRSITSSACAAPAAQSTAHRNGTPGFRLAAVGNVSGAPQGRAPVFGVALHQIVVAQATASREDNSTEISRHLFVDVSQNTLLFTAGVGSRSSIRVPLTWNYR